jgi:hypothetical protein
VCASHAGSGRTTVNSFLPFHLSSANALTIVSFFGALIGLYLFFCGFSLLHRASPPRVNAPKVPASLAMTSITTTTTYTTQGSDTLTRDTHREIIRLSPSGDEPGPAVSLSQQGKIAAALLRAGISNPASWSTPPGGVPVSVKTKNLQAREDRTTHPRQALDRKTSKVLKSSVDDRTLCISRRTRVHTSNRQPAFMLWGGALLALASIYAITAQLGWL